MRWVVTLLVCLAFSAFSQTGPEGSYLLGPGDELVIRALEAEEIAEKPVRIDLGGYIRLPLVGRLKAGGLTVDQLTAELNDKLKEYIQDPQVAVSVPNTAASRSRSSAP